MSPIYYASGETAESYSIVGRHFSEFLSDAMGFNSFVNDNPTQHINDGSGSSTAYTLTVIDDNHATLTRVQSTVITAPSYLGAIVDRITRVPLWVNNSRPLP